MRTVRGPRAEGVHKIGCDHCGAVLECKMNELRFVSDQRDGDAYVMKCPHCMHESWIGAEMLRNDRRLLIETAKRRLERAKVI